MREAAGLPGLRFAAWEIQADPGAREVVGSNPTDPTISWVQQPNFHAIRLILSRFCLSFRS